MGRTAEYVRIKEVLGSGDLPRRNAALYIETYRRELGILHGVILSATELADLSAALEKGQRIRVERRNHGSFLSTIKRIAIQLSLLAPSVKAEFEFGSQRMRDKALKLAKEI